MQQDNRFNPFTHAIILVIICILYTVCLIATHYAIDLPLRYVFYAVETSCLALLVVLWTSYIRM